jgi:hypothetical protein
MRRNCPMAEPRSDDRSQARREAAILLGVDIEDLSAADGLRVDMVSALRLVIDHEQASILDGGAADLGKLNVAVQSLIALLPGRELPAPESQHGDPRVEMFKIYKQMRERGEIGLKPDAGQVEALQDEVATLKAEIAELKGAGSISDQVNPKAKHDSHLPPSLRPHLRSAPAITPTEVVPPGELGDCHARPVAGPDDPPPRSTRVIEGKANPPVASAAPPAKRPPSWDGTPHAKAWRAWHDAGGPGFDRWSNRNA